MATKDHLLFPEKGDVNGVSSFSNVNGQYNNLNLNANQTCPALETVQSKSISSNSNQNRNYACNAVLDENTLHTNNKSFTWNKADSGCSNNSKHLITLGSTENGENKKQWQNSDEKKKASNSSTLSLHIAAYENSIEAPVGLNSAENDEIGSKQKRFNKTSKNVKTFSPSTALGCFEIPRQQSEGAPTSAPEIMQFNASQKLINPNGDARVRESTNVIARRASVSLSREVSLQNNYDAPQIEHGNSIIMAALGQMFHLGDVYDQYNVSRTGTSIFSSKVRKYVEVTLMEGHNCIFICGDSLNKKREKFKLGGELDVSIMSGMIQADGIGEYLQTSSSNGRETTASLICQVRTMHERINIYDENIKNLIDLDALRNCPPGAVVSVEVISGGHGFARSTYKRQSDESQRSVEAKLKARFCGISAFSLTAEGAGINDENVSNSNETYMFECHVDALPEEGKIARTPEEANEFMLRIPSMLKNANNGKGIPLSVVFVPVTRLKSIVTGREIPRSLCCKIDENIVNQLAETLDELRSDQNKVICLFEDLNESNCVEEKVLRSIENKRRDLKNAELDLQKEFKSGVVAVRKNIKKQEILSDALKRYESSDLVGAAVTMFCNQFNYLKEKARFIQYLKMKNVKCIGKDDSLMYLHMQEDFKDWFEFYCDWSSDSACYQNSQLFKHLLNDGKTLIFIDSQINDARVEEFIPEGNRICEYVNRSCVDIDYLQTWKEERKRCVARCTGPTKLVTQKSNNRIDLELPCPQSVNGKCDKTEVKWECPKCESTLQLDLGDYHVYCQCPYSMGSIYDFEFWCWNPQHGWCYTKFDKAYLATLLEKKCPYGALNLLWLGETGAGKSSLQNSFANHQTNETFEEAEQSDFICPIPCYFMNEEEVIEVGESENECFEVGKSATQNPTPHVFNINETMVRCFDTPGIGDTDGPMKDKENIAKILDCISVYGEMHGICIVLHPDKARLNIFLDYVFGTLLENLPKSAVNNISFCFTHARECRWKPGKTYSILKSYLNKLHEKNPEIQIALTPENVFYFDSGPQEYLCLSKNGVDYGEDERQDYKKCWEKSGKEMLRLISHHKNDIKPRKVKEITSLNEARGIIQTATPVLVEITKAVQINSKEMENHEEYIKQLDSEKAKLLGGVKVKHIDIKRKNVDDPQTVCFKCAETRKLPNSDATNRYYKTVCHHDCGLPNNNPGVISNPALQRCLAMNKNGYCTNCGCSWESHLHITYTQELVEEFHDDPNVLLAIERNESDKIIKEAALQTCKERSNQYAEIQKKINESLAVFVSFLKSKSILPYNGTIENYLKLNIERAQKEDPGNEDLIEKLVQQLEQFEEEKKILDKRLATGEVREIQIGDIETLQRELESLPLYGKTFKNLFDAHIRGQQLNRTYLEQHFNPYNYSKNPKSAKQKSKNEKGIINAAKSKIQQGYNYLTKQ